MPGDHTRLPGIRSNSADTITTQHDNPSGASQSSSGTGTPQRFQDERFPQALHRQRTQSLPTTTNPEFASTYRSVRMNGVLPQTTLQNRQIDFHASNDGANARNEIDVTRMPGNPGRHGLQQTHDAARAAVQNPAHGALSVALERDGRQPLHTETRRASPQELEHSLTDQQKAELPDLMKYMGMTREQALEVVAGSHDTTVLSGQGQQQASERMHNTFMVTARAHEPSTQTTAHEITRPSIAPSQFTSVQVPAQHAATARQVDRELAARAPVHPPAQTVHSMPGLQPNYQQVNGATMQISGVDAPDYHSGLTRQMHQSGDVDAHIVKTGLPRED